MDVGDVIKTGLDNGEQVEAVVLMTREQTEVINYEYFMRQLSQSDSDAVTANR